MGYFGINELTAKNGSGFTISRDTNEWKYESSDGIYGDEGYADLMCANYTGDYDNVLVAGLGIGVIPAWFAHNKDCNVDVVEISSALVDEIQLQGYLDDKITLIKGDIFEYTPTKSYDLIVIDIWWDKYAQTYKDEFNDLKTALSSWATEIDAPYLDI